jgi:hypothetical protein
MRASEDKKSGPSVSVAGLQSAAHFAGKIISGSMAVAQLKNGNPLPLRALRSLLPLPVTFEATAVPGASAARTGPAAGVPGLPGPCETGKEGKHQTGLTRQNKFNWAEEAKSIVADFHPDLVVVSLGLNDIQSIVEANRTRTNYGTPAWSKKYGEMVGTLLQSLSAAPAGILWIGNPVHRDQRQILLRRKGITSLPRQSAFLVPPPATSSPGG